MMCIRVREDNDMDEEVAATLRGREEAAATVIIKEEEVKDQKVDEGERGG